MNKRLALLLSAPLLLLTSLRADPIPARSLELAGSGHFAYHSVDGGDMQEMRLSPSLHYYATPNFFIGPRMEGEFRWTKDSKASLYFLGGEGGFITSSVAENTHVYAGGGASMVSSAFRIDGLANDSEIGWAASAFIGLKFRLAGSFYLNLQPTFEHATVDGDARDSFYFRTGLSGIF